MLGRDSWVCFNPRSYDVLPLRPADTTVLDKLSLAHHISHRMTRAYKSKTGASLHLRYAGSHRVSILYVPQMLEVGLVRSSVAGALPGHYLAEMLCTMASSRYQISSMPAVIKIVPLVGSAELEPEDFLGVASARLFCVPWTPSNPCNELHLLPHRTATDRTGNSTPPPTNPIPFDPGYRALRAGPSPFSPLPPRASHMLSCRPRGVFPSNCRAQGRRSADGFLFSDPAVRVAHHTTR